MARQVPVLFVRALLALALFAALAAPATGAAVRRVDGGGEKHAMFLGRQEILDHGDHGGDASAVPEHDGNGHEAENNGIDDCHDNGGRDDQEGHGHGEEENHGSAVEDEEEAQAPAEAEADDSGGGDRSVPVAPADPGTPDNPGEYEDSDKDNGGSNGGNGVDDDTGFSGGSGEDIAIDWEKRGAIWGRVGAVATIVFGALAFLQCYSARN